MSDTRARDVADALMAREGTAPAGGLALDEAAEGFARVRMIIRKDMLNGHGTAHGGMIFALADTAFAYACNSQDIVTVAQSATIVFLAPAVLGDVLVAEAREAMSAHRSGVYQVEVRTIDGRPIANFQGLSRSVGGSILNLEEDT